MTETIVTTENMYRIAAELQFEVEAELGHNLPAGAIYPTVRNGDARVVVNAEKCGEAGLTILMRRCEEGSV